MICLSGTCYSPLACSAFGFCRERNLAEPLDPSGNLECHCIPGHRSNHVTHRCEICGLSDFEVADGKTVPPCIPREDHSSPG
jgi:hypothetical protein